MFTLLAALLFSALIARNIQLFLHSGNTDTLPVVVPNTDVNYWHRNVR